MMRLVYALSLMLALAGCTTGPSLESQMAAYIGSSETGLVQKLGVPARQITVNNVTYLAYELRNQTQLQPGDYAWGGPYWGGWGPYPYAIGRPMMPQDIRVWSCEVTFVLASGKVQSFTLRGNDCQ
ncbi:MAG: hypothetical protein KJS74_01020 [Rhodospirillales bacterium]|nr:hypothetical protein [Rhodospirillales bacterium]